MKVLRISLKPLEPYFFGNERSLFYEGINTKVQAKASNYFVRSEETPLQSTLFGVLRYMGIAEKNANFKLNQTDIDNIGAFSFQLRKKDQSFGKIRQISNLYLEDGDGNLYIRVPADQENFQGSDPEKIYSGFQTFSPDPVQMQSGIRYIPKVNLKNGFFDGYMRIKDGVCVPSSDIFQKIVKTGIHVKQTADALFKKEYCFLERYRFVFFAEVEDDFPAITDRYVKMGQKKTAFAVTAAEWKEPPDSIRESAKLCLASPFPTEAVKIVLLSDSYVEEVRKLYDCCYFIHSITRDYRAMETIYNAVNQRQRYKKQEVLLRLLKAGSVFWVKPDKIEEFISLLDDREARIAGFNRYAVAHSAGPHPALEATCGF